MGQTTVFLYFLRLFFFLCVLHFFLRTVVNHIAFFKQTKNTKIKPRQRRVFRCVRCASLSRAEYDRKRRCTRTSIDPPSTCGGNRRGPETFEVVLRIRRYVSAATHDAPRAPQAQNSWESLGEGAVASTMASGTSKQPRVIPQGSPAFPPNFHFEV